MKIYKQIGLLLGGVVLIIMCFVFVFAMLMNQGMCGNKIIQSIESPDSIRKVVVFERDCGATTDFSTQISIIKNGEHLENESGNIFSADSDYGNAKIDENGLVYIKVLWLDYLTLLIEYDSKARIFTNKSNYKDISIIYKKIER